MSGSEIEVRGYVVCWPSGDVLLAAGRSLSCRGSPFFDTLLGINLALVTEWNMATPPPVSGAMTFR